MDLTADVHNKVDGTLSVVPIVSSSIVCPTDIWYLSPLVCLFFLALIPVWVVVARQSPQIREVLRSGWQPVIIAMSISRYTLYIHTFSLLILLEIHLFRRNVY